MWWVSGVAAAFAIYLDGRGGRRSAVLAEWERQRLPSRTPTRSVGLLNSAPRTPTPYRGTVAIPVVLLRYFDLSRCAARRMGRRLFEAGRHPPLDARGGDAAGKQPRAKAAQAAEKPARSAKAKPEAAPEQATPESASEQPTDPVAMAE